jgi:uncharacterized protein (TIGR03083 family)
MDTWEMIDAERTAVADLADSLTPAQWDAATLCTAWKTRDVVAHLNVGATSTTGKTLGALVRYGFRIDAMLQGEAIKDGKRSTEDLRKDARAAVGQRRTPPGIKPESLLVDYVVHEQDIRRPLGLPRTIPPDTLAAALDRVVDIGSSLVPGKKRSSGLRLRATDIGWEHGEGEEVSGPGEALLMNLAGRADALDELAGPGLATLRARVGG